MVLKFQRIALEFITYIMSVHIRDIILYRHTIPSGIGWIIYPGDDESLCGQHTQYYYYYHFYYYYYYYYY